MTIKDELGLFRVEHNSVNPARGLCLVSVPMLKDGFFRKTVVYMTEHNEDGSLAFIINKPISFVLHELIDGIPESRIPVYFGGPVANDSIHFIHTLGDIIPRSKHVAHGVYWGGDFDVIKEQLSRDISISQQMRFFVGYSGWDPGQLAGEIAQDTWLVTHVPSSTIFSKNGVTWEVVLKTMGFKYELWANFPESAVLN